MLDWNQPLRTAINLHAGSLAVAIAEDNRVGQNFDGLDTTDGRFLQTYRLPYVSGSRPSLVVWQRGSKVIVAVAGINGVQDAIAVYRGWISPATMPDTPGIVNAFAKTWFDNSIAALSFIFDPAITDYAFFGHSWGSTTATILANIAARQGHGRNVLLATYGAPRFADEVFINQMRSNAFSRVMNYADIVPYIIPTWREAPNFTALHDPFAIRNFNKMRHQAGGIQIRLGQQMIFYEGPAGLSYPLDLNPANLRSHLANGATPHLADTYVAVMASYLQSADPAQQQPQGALPKQGAEDGPTFDKQTSERIADFPDTPWPTTEQKGNVPGVPVPPPAPPVPVFTELEGGSGIVIKRIGRRWYVSFQDVPVYKAESKRDARAWARAARKFAEQFRQRPEFCLNTDTIADMLNE